MNKAASSFSVNPVFDPAEDGKEASARGARPSVSGACQCSHSELRALSSCGAARGGPPENLVEEGGFFIVTVVPE